MKFGEILKNLRIEKGLTQKELANACNVTATCICQLENGSRNPTGSTVAVLARFFDVSSDYLLGLSDEGIHFGGKVEKTPADGYEVCYNFSMKLGDLIKYLRESKGYSQQQLADKAEISRSVLSQYENNSVDPTAYVVKKLAITLEVSSDYLLGLSDEGIHFGGKVEKTPVAGNTVEERELLEDYHELSKEGKELVKATIKTLLGSARSGKAKKA